MLKICGQNTFFLLFCFKSICAAPVSDDIEASNRALVRHKNRAADQPPRAGTGGRHLADQSNITAQHVCQICAVPGTKRRSSAVPAWTKAASRVPLNAVGAPPKDNTTCEEWESYVATAFSSPPNEAPIPTSSDCLDWRAWLERQCCDGLAPLYECETAVKEELLFSSNGAHYMKNTVPITTGTLLSVGVALDISDLSISNHGVDGGSIETKGRVHLSWIDERLKWNSSTAGCVSIKITADEIWVPGIGTVVDDEDEVSFLLSEPDMSVSADGRVFLSRYGTLWFTCEGGVDGVAKRCWIDLLDGDESGSVRYFSSGLEIPDPLSLPEYRLGSKRSIIPETDEATMHGLHVELDLDPIDRTCNICGHAGAILRDGLIHDYPAAWLDAYPDTNGWSCSQLDSLLTTIDVLDDLCLMGRAYYEESCCDDKLSSHDCESNIHDQIVEMHNTITPPDPSPKENDPFFASIDQVDVQVSLDVHHLNGIDVKSNSLSLLVSLDLEWYDQRLEWQPFIGGCHRASYRASLDAELTEIWVPNIELVNMVEGIQSLPEAHASVRYDGHVMWRRTGVLVGSCDLTGISKFPFDETGCYLEFGGTRDPLYHRLNYVPTLFVEYTQHMKDDSWNYQEYKLDSTKYSVENRTEKLSGFDNNVIRFQFYFTRAQTYYVNLFVLLYIIFTFLSFGMYFVDYHLSDRLGYGSSILFVLVAQDITLADSTPVTQEFLWIYQLSFGSKMFVIVSVVQSIFVLYIHSLADLDQDDEREVEDSSLEERKSFLSCAEAIQPCAQESAIAPPNSSSQESQRESMLSDEPEDIEQPTSPVASDHSQQESEQRSGCSSFKKVEQRKKKPHTRRLLWVSRKALKFDFEESDSKLQRTRKRLRMVDLSCAIFCIIAYLIFLIVMFATV